MYEFLYNLYSVCKNTVTNIHIYILYTIHCLLVLVVAFYNDKNVYV